MPKNEVLINIQNIFHNNVFHLQLIDKFQKKQEKQNVLQIKHRGPY